MCCFFFILSVRFVSKFRLELNTLDLFGNYFSLITKKTVNQHKLQDQIFRITCFKSHKTVQFIISTIKKYCKTYRATQNVYFITNFSLLISARIYYIYSWSTLSYTCFFFFFLAKLAGWRNHCFLWLANAELSFFALQVCCFNQSYYH